MVISLLRRLFDGKTASHKCDGIPNFFTLQAQHAHPRVPALPVGYGFTAIIVAFLGRLTPIGVLLAGFVMALTYIGGEAAQIEMNLPSAITGVFQGMFLFSLLGIDVFARYRIRLAHGRSISAGH